MSTTTVQVLPHCESVDDKFYKCTVDKVMRVRLALRQRHPKKEASVARN